MFTCKLPIVVKADGLASGKGVIICQSKKEVEILQLILSGRTNTEISDSLGKSKRTIETHRFNLMKKLNVKNLIELSSKAKELGFS